MEVRVRYSSTEVRVRVRVRFRYNFTDVRVRVKVRVRYSLAEVRVGAGWGRLCLGMVRVCACAGVDVRLCVHV